MKNITPQKTNKERIERMIKEHYPKIALAIALLSVPQSCFALFGGDGPAVATETTQVAQWIADEIGRAKDIAEQVQQTTTAASQLQQDIQTVQQGYQNLEKLSAADLAGWNKYIDQLSGIMVQTNGLAYNMAELDNKFSENFPMYDDVLNNGKTGDLKAQASSYAAMYKALTDRNRGTAIGTLRNLKKTGEYLDSDIQTMDKLKLTSANASGNIQAIQAANEIALHQTDTLKNLHRTMLSQQSMMAQQLATENARLAAKQAQTAAWKENSLSRTKGNEKSVKTWRE